MNTPHTHIWCDQCKAIRPLIISDMHRDDASGRFSEASDLLCGTCYLVIATLYMPISKPSERRRCSGSNSLVTKCVRRAGQAES